MSGRWQDYFEKARTEHATLAAMALEHWKYHERFYQYVRTHVPPGGRILEVGCGYGFSSLYLAAHGYQVTGIDNDPDLLEVAETFRSDCLSLPYQLQLGDIRNLEAHHGKFDFVFSAGLLEHFDLEEMKALIQAQARCAPLVGINVPSRFTLNPTDERFYTLRELSWIAESLGLATLKRFGYGRPARKRWMHFLLPEAFVLLCQDRLSWAMSLCVLAELRPRRREAGGGAFLGATQAPVG